MVCFSCASIFILWMFLADTTFVESARYMGCYEDNGTNRLMKGDKITLTGTLTQEKCILHCISKGFKYAGMEYKYECFCSHERPSFRAIRNPTECDSKCDGDRKQICGGGWRLSVYDIEDKGVNYVQTYYVGCYRDSDGRALKGELLESSSMTPEMCVGYCYGRGNVYAGVQYGTQCFCGDKIEGDKAEEGDCSQSCAGDSRFHCGGGHRNNIYRTVSSSASFRYMGCYKENSIEARLMHGLHKDFKGTLTPEKCVAFCKSNNYTYAGVQYGYECFCSNERPPFKSFADPKQCNSRCEGDDRKFCGGSLRLSVYDIPNKKVNFVQSNYIGCYADDGEKRRALRDKASPEFNEMTPEFCTGYCYSFGYRYAGVQHRRQCFCGDEIKGDRTSEGECDQDCFGDSRLLCGGNWRNSIYSTSISDESEDGRLVGCFIDSDSLRLLSGYRIDLRETNSPRRCMNICLQLGFKFSGVEHGVECYCGNKSPPRDRETGENECLALCPNSRQRLCGGDWRLSVYSTSSLQNRPQPPVIIVPGNQVTSIIQTQQPQPQQPRPTEGGGGGGQTLAFQRPQATTTRRPPARPTTARTTTESWSSGGGGSAGNGWNSGGGGSGGNGWNSGGEFGGGQGTGCVQSKTDHAGKLLCEGDLIFQEKFNAWDEKWKHEIFMPDGPDYEFVVFDNNRTNIFLQNGKLFIRPTIFSDEFVRRGNLRLEKCTGRSFTEECEREGRGFSLLPPARSARITTKESFSFKYGKVVVNARLPAGDWIVPEIWLEPKEHAYGPGYQSGRILIAHALGNRDLSYNGADIGSRRLEQGLLMGTAENKVRGRKRIKPNERNKSWYDDFHNYTLIWTPDNIYFQVDDEERDSLIPRNSGKLYTLVGFDRYSADQWDRGSSIAPFDQQFYLSIGVSVGGMKEFPDNCLTGQGHVKPWKNMAVKGLVDFWNDRVNWYPTWNNNKFGLEVAEISVYAL